MVLGTVELGLDYGINNKEGKPSFQQAFELLDVAWKGGIRELDTAAAYGNSEEIIGLFQKETGYSFLIDTKLPVSVSYECLQSSLLSSCERLNTKHINLLYLHSFNQCKDQRMIDYLNTIKREGRVSHIGISIYEPSEMEYIIMNLPEIDTIQFPYNLLDNYRWEENKLLEKAIFTGKRLYVRSVFLQGLFFKDVSDEFVTKTKASSFVSRIQSIASEADMSVAELAYKFVLDKPEIESVILGCQRKEEVLINLALEKSEKHISDDLRRKIEHLSEIVPTSVIDPRKWKQ